MLLVLFLLLQRHSRELHLNLPLLFLIRRYLLIYLLTFLENLLHLGDHVLLLVSIQIIDFRILLVRIVVSLTFHGHQRRFLVLASLEIHLLILLLNKILRSRVSLWIIDTDQFILKLCLKIRLLCLSFISMQLSEILEHLKAFNQIGVL